MNERTERPRTGLRRGALALLLAGVAACGNLTAGGFGEATVVVSADAPEAASQTARLGSSVQPSSVAAETARTTRAAAEGDRPEGQLDAEMLLYLVSDGGTLVSLSDDVVEVQVDLEGVEQDETLPKVVPADSYSSLRVVFLEIEVRVDAGLVIGGDTITGPIEIDMESDTLVVERAISLLVEDGDRAEILVDLNAASWLQAVDPITSTVSAQDFADLIAVVVR